MIYNWPDSINEKVKKQVLTQSPVINTSEIDSDSISQNLLDESNLPSNTEIDSSNNQEQISFTADSGGLNINLGDGKIFGDITFNQLFQLSESELRNKLVDKSWIEKNFILQIQKVVLNFSDMLQFLSLIHISEPTRPY